MKRLILFLILCVVSLGFVGCDKPKISYSENYVSIYENQEYEIDENKISIVGKTNSYSVISLDTNIAKIRDNLVIPVSSGKTQIRLKLDTKKNVYYDFEFEVLAGKIVKTISCENSLVTLNMTDTSNTAVNKVFVNSDATEIPVVRYDSEIIDYDYTNGLITAHKAGQTVVTVKYLFCEISFDVNVIKKIYTESLEVQDQKIFRDSKGKFEFNVKPANATVLRFWSDSKELIVLRDGSYYFQGEVTGKVQVKYEYFKSETAGSSTGSFWVEVIDKAKDFSVRILDENSQNVSEFLEGKEYNLIIGVTQNYPNLSFEFSPSIECQKPLEFVENLGFKTTVILRANSDNLYSITYKNSLAGVENIFTKNLSLNVASTKDISIRITCGTYFRNSDEDGIYRLSLDDAKTGIAFILDVKGNQINENPVVYLKTSDLPELVNGSIKISSVGTYIFEVYLNQDFIGNVTIIVE